MAAHSTTQLLNGHSLTISEQVDSAGRHQWFRVEERNELGTFIAFAYSAHTLAECEAAVARAVERGYGLRPTIGDDALSAAFGPTASERIRAAREARET